uniref:Uncharacterized protein n=1 Tax=Aegilops tauschii subsp. strangulata TaxID=200361 RepID=A0A453BQU4_AEGTS
MYGTSLRRCHSIFNLNTCYRSLECLAEICWFTSSLKGSNHCRATIACNCYSCIYSLYLSLRLVIKMFCIKGVGSATVEKIR